jgi:hypothetical protein
MMQALAALRAKYKLYPTHPIGVYQEGDIVVIPNAEHGAQVAVVKRADGEKVVVEWGPSRERTTEVFDSWRVLRPVRVSRRNPHTGTTVFIVRGDGSYTVGIVRGRDEKGLLIAISGAGGTTVEARVPPERAFPLGYGRAFDNILAGPVVFLAAEPMRRRAFMRDQFVAAPPSEHSASGDPKVLTLAKDFAEAKRKWLELHTQRLERIPEPERLAFKQKAIQTETETRESYLERKARDHIRNSTENKALSSEEHRELEDLKKINAMRRELSNYRGRITETFYHDNPEGKAYVLWENLALVIPNVKDVLHLNLSKYGAEVTIDFNKLPEGAGATKGQLRVLVHDYLQNVREGNTQRAEQLLYASLCTHPDGEFIYTLQKTFLTRPFVEFLGVAEFSEAVRVERSAAPGVHGPVEILRNRALGVSLATHPEDGTVDAAIRQGEGFVYVRYKRAEGGFLTLDEEATRGCIACHALKGTFNANVLNASNQHAGSIFETQGRRLDKIATANIFRDTLPPVTQ